MPCPLCAVVFLPSMHAQYHTAMLFNYLPLCDPASFSLSRGMLVMAMVAVAKSSMLLLLLVFDVFESWT